MVKPLNLNMEFHKINKKQAKKNSKKIKEFDEWLRERRRKK